MNPVRWLQEAQRIHGVCPCCDTVFRLSQAQVFINARPPTTPFDKHAAAVARFERSVMQWESERDIILEEQRQRGIAAADAELNKISPVFIGRGISPRDVKVLFDPVRYVVFRGMTANDMTGIELIDNEPTTTTHERLVCSIGDAIKKGNVDWATWRVTDAGRVIKEQ